MPKNASALGDRVVQVKFNGFGDLRNHALAACTHEWIFSLDSDERWTEAVRDEILALIAGSPPPSKFLLPWGGVTRFWTSLISLYVRITMQNGSSTLSATAEPRRNVPVR